MDDIETAFKTSLVESEARMMGLIQKTLKGIVIEQLKNAGFDPDLSTGALSTNPAVLASATDSLLVGCSYMFIVGSTSTAYEADVQSG